MKRYLSGIPVFALVLASLVSAQSQSQKVRGHLVDAVCAGNHAHKPGYAAGHENSCNLMPGCSKTGFTVITADNKVFKFDQKGNEQALALVKATKKEKDLKVIVTGIVDAQTIAVSSIAVE